MIESEVGPPRGVLRIDEAERTGPYFLSRLKPDDRVAVFVEHYWIVSWDLEPGDEYLAETLPHPNVVLTFERDNARIQGVMRGKFSRRLRGRGLVFGVKFKAGGFFPFYGADVAELTDRQVPVAAVFGQAGAALEDEILVAGPDRRAMADRMNEFLLARLPETDPVAARTAALVRLCAEDTGIQRVEDLIARRREIAGEPEANKRALQRNFRKYVGVSPKWVIQRYRLHEALDRIERGESIDWPRLALELGYFDQAHFIRDFKKLVGVAPGEYAARTRPKTDAPADAP